MKAFSDSKKLFFIIAVPVLFIYALFCIMPYLKYDVFSEYPIAHALGSIEGYTYTNSLEAFELNYSLGHRIFEVDLVLTSDKKLVCRHGWDDLSEDEIPTKEEFLNTKIEGKFTALSIDDILVLMMEYDDIYIVTDTKYTETDKITIEFEEIINAAEELGAEDVLDRMIVQIYNDEMLDTVKSIYHFKTYIYTLYQDWDKTEESFIQYLKFCRRNNIRHITVKKSALTYKMLDAAESYGVHILVYTIDDVDTAEAYINAGVETIYTNSLSPDDIS